MTVWRKLEPLYITGENVNGVVVKGLNSFGSSKSKNLPNDLAIPLPGINPTEVKTETQVLFASVHISIIHCLKGGNNRVHPHMNEWIKCGICMDIQCSQPWKGLNSDTCYNMDEPLKHCARWNKSRYNRTDIVWFYIYKIPIIGKLIETKSRLEIARSLGRGENWEVLLSGYSGSVWESFERVLEIVVMVAQCCNTTEF